VNCGFPRSIELQTTKSQKKMVVHSIVRMSILNLFEALYSKERTHQKTYIKVAKNNIKEDNFWIL
jgi:hypothetical protein